MTTTIPYPRLENVTAESIRFFIRQYDPYVRELASRANQIVAAGASAESVRPIAIKYCIDEGYLESLLSLGFIEGVSSYDELQEGDLRNFREKQSATSKSSMKIETLDCIVKKELRTDMRDEDDVSRIRNFFISYHGLLRSFGLSWVTEKKPSVAVRHVASAIKPEALRTRL